MGVVELGGVVERGAVPLGAARERLATWWRRVPFETGSLPPWLLIWVVYAAYSFPHSLSGSLSLVASGRRMWAMALPTALPLIANDVFTPMIWTLFVPHAVGVIGLLTVALPHLRGLHLKWRYKLHDHPPNLYPRLERIMGDISDFVVLNGPPDVRLTYNLRRSDLIAFAYPLGYRTRAVALFGGLVKKWAADRQAAQAVLLHELAHIRHGDVLLVGAGSPLTYALGLWPLLAMGCAHLVIWGGVLAFAVQQGFVWTSATSALLLKVVLLGELSAVFFGGVFLCYGLALYLVLIFATWSAELDADLGAGTHGGHGPAVIRALAMAHEPGSLVARWALRITHPPVWLRTRVAHHRTSFLVVALLLVPLAHLAQWLLMPLVQYLFAPLTAAAEYLSGIPLEASWAVPAPAVRSMVETLSIAALTACWPLLSPELRRGWVGRLRFGAFAAVRPYLSAAALLVGAAFFPQALGALQARADARRGAEVIRSSADWPVMISDDFAADSGYWPVGTAANSLGTTTMSIDGAHRWEMVPLQDVKMYHMVWTRKKETSVSKDFRLSIDAEYLSGYRITSDLLFLFTDTKNYYALRIEQSARTYLIYEMVGGHYREIFGWTHTPSINPDGGNRLTVVAEGGRTTFVINGTYVATARLTKLSAGQVGFAAWQLASTQPLRPSSVQFDNLELRVPAAR